MSSHKYTDKPVNPIGKIPGGGRYMARKLADLMPDNISWYFEPYMGMASTFLNLGRAHYEHAILCDADWAKVNLHRVVRDYPGQFLNMLRQVQYDDPPKIVINTFEQCKTAWDRSWAPLQIMPENPDDQLTAALHYLVKVRMSRGGMGQSFSTSDRKRGGQNEGKNAWEGMIRDTIPMASSRLQGVNIIHIKAEEILRAGGPASHLHLASSFTYCDPPYLHHTRQAKGVYGPFEMSNQQHEHLAGLLHAFPGRVMIAGNPSDLYESWYRHWHRIGIDMANAAGQGETKGRRETVIWTNYTPNAKAVAALKPIKIAA